MNATTVLSEIKSFLQQAGTLGLSIQQSAERSEKADKSIVTEADLAISALFQKQFGHYLNQPGHALIDEEVAKKPLEEVLAADYQWVIDPIDGTATYACGGLFWGIIISVFRKGEPWLAAVYVPPLRRLYWADETTAYETTDAFTAQEATVPLNPVIAPLTHSAQVHMHAEFVPQVFANTPFIVVDYWSPLHSAMVCAGRLTFSIFKDALWDFGAGMVFATRTGLGFRRVADGKMFTKLDAELLTPNFKCANHMCIGPNDVYEALKPSFNPKLSLAA